MDLANGAESDAYCTMIVAAMAEEACCFGRQYGKKEGVENKREMSRRSEHEISMPSVSHYLLDLDHCCS
jgi:hypothetical protein